MSEPHDQGFVPGKHAIDSYGKGGFRFGGLSHRGSILALPSGVHAWNVTRADEINAQTLAPVFTEPEGSIEYLMIGMGTAPLPLAPALREQFREAGIVVETMTTGDAAHTYSLLLREDRLVAAALVAVV